jgi:hypothetical protein
MGKIPMYGHYYMSEDEILELKKKEIMEIYSQKGYVGLSGVERDWFDKFFPQLAEKGEVNGRE